MPSTRRHAGTRMIMMMASKRKRKSKAVPKFTPQKTAFVASHVCWDVILANPAAMACLGSWRWIGTLSRVFGRLPDQMALWMDGTIWKKKANELFALTAKDIAGLKYEVVESSSYYGRDHEVHLMRRSEVLQLALAKHGGTIAAINDAFIARKKRNAKRKKPARRHASRCLYYSDDDVLEGDF
jgi:hypothetical protein